MYETFKSAQVLSEMQQHHLDILGVSECCWTGSACQRISDGSTILCSGHQENHTSGVALIIAKKKVNTSLEWEAISGRIIRARFNSQHCKLMIIQCYAPTNEAEDDVKDEWYEQLLLLLLIIGDLNAKVGAENTNYERAMGKH